MCELRLRIAVSSALSSSSIHPCAAGRGTRALATWGSSWERKEKDDDACGWGVGRSRRMAWGHVRRGREAMAGAPVPLSSTARTSASTRRIGGGAFGSGPELGGFTHGRAASPSSLNAMGNRPWSPAAASQLLLPIIFSKTMVPCCLLQLQFCHLCATQQIVFSTSIRRKQLQFSFTRQSGWFRI